LRPFIVGVGRAGCRIANLFLLKGYKGILLDTERSDLVYFPYKYKSLLGEKFVDGNGTGKDLKMGRQIMDAEKYNVVDRMDQVKDDMDSIFVFSAMGGGTGGAVDILIEEFRKSYTEPVYYAGTIPSKQDYDNVLINFSENFKRLGASCHAMFPIDIDLLRGDRRLRGMYNVVNKRIFSYFFNLFQVGEYRSREELGKNVLGTTDVVNTLSGVSTIGVGAYGLDDTEFRLSKARDENVDKPELVVSLTRKAVENTLLPLDIKDSKRAMAVVYGPKRYLDFLGSIPARLWVENNIGGVEVRGGDIPSAGKKNFEVMVLLSGIKKSERLRYMYQLGKMQKDRGMYSEKISRIFDRLDALNSKIADAGVDSRSIYDDLKSIMDEPVNDKESI
jgi:cell division GTPase FtsZ